MIYSVLGWILNQDFFSALIIVAAIATWWHYRHEPISTDLNTQSICLWVSLYFSTQVPLTQGWWIPDIREQAIVQTSISMILVMFYAYKMCGSAWTAGSAIAETLICFAGLIWTYGADMAGFEIHPWYRWTAIGCLNYVSFFCLLRNKWGDKKRDRRPVGSAARSGISVEHILAHDVPTRKDHQRER